MVHYRCDQGTTGWKYSASENVHISFDVAVMSIIAQAVGEAGIPVPETKSQGFLSHLEANGTNGIFSNWDGWFERQM